MTGVQTCALPICFPVTISGGGGAASPNIGTGVGGSGGGGNGETGANNNSTAGGTNTGGGGGGGRDNPGKAGGSGIVVLRYADTFADITVNAGLTYTKTTTGGYKIYTFTAGTGTITI